MNTLSFDPQTTWAFLIGNWEFQDQQLPNLPSVEKNIESLIGVLSDPLILGIPKDQVISLKNQSHILQQFITTFPKPIETLIVYYAGHGLCDNQQKLYFALPNSLLKNPKTGFPFENLWEEITNKATNIILILDCCLSGKAFNTAKKMVNKNISILTATLPNENALAPKQWTHTTFTTYLIKTLREGISSSDQYLTALQLFEKIKSELKKPEPWHNDFLTTQPFYVVKNQGYITDNIMKNNTLFERTKNGLITIALLVGSLISGWLYFRTPELPKPPDDSISTLQSQLKVIGFGGTTSKGEYLINLKPPIAEKMAYLSVAGNKPLTVTLSDFPNDIFYSSIYDNPPTIKSGEQILFSVGIKLSVEQPRPEYRFAIESGDQKIPLIVNVSDWLGTIQALLNNVSKQLSSLSEPTPEKEQKTTLDLIKEIFPNSTPIIQLALTGQALQHSNRPQAAALAYTKIEEIKPGITEQFLTGQQNHQVRTEIGKLYLTKQNVTKAESWFIKAAVANYPPAQYQLGLLYQKGEGVEKNDAKSQELLKQAEQSGYVHPIEEKPLKVISPPKISEFLKNTFTNSIGMEFVLIPAGSFQMGDDNGKYDDEEPAHNVKIEKAFYLGKFEITQKQYQTIMGNNPSRFKGENRPVERVSWDDAQAFIKKLNEKEGGTKYRLPTEAEWEYAARANTQTKWSFGDNESDMKDYAWYGYEFAWYGYEFSVNETREVGQKKPNGFGLFDMHGNVWEWTCSDYKNYSENNHLECSSKNNAHKSLRGGSWVDDADDCRSASRGNHSPDFRNNNDGFRVVSVFSL